LTGSGTGSISGATGTGPKESRNFQPTGTGSSCGTLIGVLPYFESKNFSFREISGSKRQLSLKTTFQSRKTRFLMRLKLDGVN